MLANAKVTVAANDYIISLDAYFNDGYNNGFEQGIQEGIEKGIQEGIEKGMQEGIEKGIEKGIQEGIEKGMQEGIEKGGYQKALETAKKCLLKGLSVAEATELTELPIEVITKIAKELKK
jgi:predicted transposase YdaD